MYRVAVTNDLHKLNIIESFQRQLEYYEQQQLFVEAQETNTHESPTERNF